MPVVRQFRNTRTSHGHRNPQTASHLELDRRRHREPRYTVHARQVANQKLYILERAVETMASRFPDLEGRRQGQVWRRRMCRVADRYAASLQAMATLVRTDIEDFHAEVLRLLDSPQIRELALTREFYIARRKRRCGKGPRGMWLDIDGRWKRKLPTVQRIREMARAMTCDKPSSPLHRGVKPKTNGYRITFAFALQDQALKRIVADIIEAVCVPSEFDFARDGRGGHHGAATAIRKSIKIGDSRFFAVADLKDAYPSVTAKHIADIVPLPPIVIRNVLTIPADKTVMSSAFPTPTGRRLPQGAASSAVILSVLLGQTLRPMAGLYRLIVNIGDDIAIGAPTQAEADMALRTLTERLTSLRAGPLRFGRAEVQSPYSLRKFSFGGYAHRWFYDSRRLHCAPSDKSIEKMKVKLREKVRQTPPHRREKVMRKYLRAWSAAFPQWTKNEHSVSSIQTTADMIRIQIGIDELA